MAKLHTIVLLLATLILLLAVVSSEAQRSQKNRQKQKPGGQGAAGNTQKKRPRPQQAQKQKPKPNKPQQQNGPDVFTTTIPELGRIRGRTLTTEWTGQTIMQFLDVPYGSADRFKAAEPALPWKGVLSAHRHHAGCPSIQDILKFAKLEEEGFDVEDCLRLTINTKSLKGELSPVMVYIHGDFFYEGNTVEAAPGYLLEKDVVLVSVRYRLGPFGFMSTLTEDIPGNAAVTDIILALEWIQKHIAAFGGDPRRVTLFGQVGGAAMVNVLTLSPAVPKGLFHRVIYQSGTALSPAFITDSPMPATKDIAKIVGCKQLTKTDSLNKCLQRVNATTLLAAFSIHGEDKPSLSGGAYGGVQLVIGGPSGILPEHPGRLLAAEKFQAYPTLGGSVKHGGTFLLRDIFVESFNESVAVDKLSGQEYIDTVIQQANGEDPTGSWRAFAAEEIFTATDIKNGSFKRLTPGLIDLCSTISLKNPVLLVLQANAKKLPNSTYLYSFDYEGELNRYSSSEEEASFVPFDSGVTLTDDNLYLFPWPRFHLINSVRDIKIAKRMVDLWTSFAAAGVPRAPGVPDWPPMSVDIASGEEATGPYMRIGRTVSFGDNFLDEYSIAVQEAKLGYTLVNEDYYEIEEAILASKKGGQVPVSNANLDEDNDESDEEGDTDANEARGQNLVFIAKKYKS
ncbi:uncharacterized protein Dwil_GK18668 [Drosophila willistoni]|uniref:Carboxylesterase type B domain-containing protein n=1 Tax=Drosophila willistoni TaxID=7260 RepID=B4N7S8_DROWI|nr:glutactin [Drosophila willistoni]EDW80417.1 uncharacterized protein Dwil_GK18668 [Drosophila willistoni]